ncbi:MAG: hypothetical protein V1709_05500 [Planctomycetota bacterium]
MKIGCSGRPGLEDIEAVKQRLIQLIAFLKISHPERIRKAYNQQYRSEPLRKISWISIRKYLNELKNEGKIKEEILTQGKKRTLSFIKLNLEV